MVRFFVPSNSEKRCDYFEQVLHPLTQPFRQEFVRQLDAQQPTLFHQKAGIKSRLNDIPRFCKEIMMAQQTGSADDLAAVSGLTEALQSIDWKNQYVWAYAWEAIEDMDVNLASEGNSYYDPGRMKMFI